MAALMIAVLIPALISVDLDSPVQTEFGLYRPYPVDLSPSLKPYSISNDLSNVVNSSSFPLTSLQRRQIAERGFLAILSDFEQIYDAYKSLERRGLPIFITTDSVLHAFHIIYDYALRALEFERLYYALESLVRSMLRASIQQYESARSDTAREAALKNIAFFDVAARLLGIETDVPPEARRLSDEELRLIESHASISRSPIFGYREDYTQYIPRGHYTRNERFERFFKAMMWFGRMGFRLNDELQTLQALLITAAMQGEDESGRPLMELWDGIYEPTCFFVGKADDLTVRHYTTAAVDVYGPGFASLSPDELADPVKLSRFVERAQSFEDPLINSSIIPERSDLAAQTKGFRFMGQRFIPDSYILWQLVHSNVEGRLMPKGLDVMAVLGSERAYEILTELYNEDRYPGYLDQLSKLRGEFASQPPEVWAQNLYWNWLYCLLPLLEPKGEGFPSFMRHPAWADKELVTALGSWAELRHDTILYAKQSYTEITSVRPRPGWESIGYVEPNPKLYARLAALAGYTADGLRRRGLLLDVIGRKLRELEELLLRLKEISERELRGEPLGEEDLALFKGYGERLERLTTFPSLEHLENEEDRSMAVVADVHTDPNTGRALEEAVGRPMWLYVVVPINGELWLTAGAMFSYYEFAQPISGRLTDGEWQTMIRSGQAPPMPEWTSTFVLPKLEGEVGPERCDLDGDGEVDIFDLVRLAKLYGRRDAEALRYDLDGDGRIGMVDLVLLSGWMGHPIPSGAPVLLPNYPNPFNPETWLPFILPRGGEVEIRIYDSLGRPVRRLDLGRRPAGVYLRPGEAPRWDGRDDLGRPMPSGIYFYEIRTRWGSDLRRMLLLK